MPTRQGLADGIEAMGLLGTFVQDRNVDGHETGHVAYGRWPTLRNLEPVFIPKFRSTSVEPAQTAFDSAGDKARDGFAATIRASASLSSTSAVNRSADVTVSSAGLAVPASASFFGFSLGGSGNQNSGSARWRQPAEHRFPGTDLSRSKGLIQGQFNKATADTATRLWVSVLNRIGKERMRGARSESSTVFLGSQVGWTMLSFATGDTLPGVFP